MMARSVLKPVVFWASGRRARPFCRSLKLGRRNSYPNIKVKERLDGIRPAHEG